MKVEISPVTKQYYLDHQIYLERLINARRKEELRSQEISKQSEHVERIQRARELEKKLGQNVDVYI